jgi:hypothetical protein
MLANIHLNPGIQLDPKLAEVVEKLALKHPSWTFQSKAVIGGTAYSDNESYHRCIAGGEALPEDTRYTRGVNVLQDGIFAGRIFVNQNYARRSDQNWHYVLRSQRIDNGRKGNMQSTRDPSTAVRTASRYFLAQSLLEMLYEAMHGARDSLQNTMRDLTRPIERAQYAPSGATMQIALYNLLKGVPFHEDEIRTAFLSERFETALANFELAHRMSAHTLKGVMMFRGHYVYLHRTWSETTGGPAPTHPFDEKDEVTKGEVRSCSFEELPQAWQDKIAVLQLMKDTELVLDVGYRFNESTFLIVE